MRVHYRQKDGITYVRTDDLSMHGLAVCGKHDKCDRGIGLAVALLRLRAPWRKRDFKLAAKIRTEPERTLVISDRYLSQYLKLRIEREHMIHSSRGRRRSAIDEQCARRLIDAWQWSAGQEAYA